MVDLVEAYALLRLEELRAELRAELEDATAWIVRALNPPAPVVQVGPYNVPVEPPQPVHGRIDLVAVAFVDDHVRPRVLLGTPSPSPQPPAVPLDLGIPLALIHRHAAQWLVYQHNIVHIGQEAQRG